MMNASNTISNVGYLGPRGTFSEEIALNLYRGVDGRFTPFTSIDGVIRAVQSGTVDEGIVPVENSIEGSVNVTLDTIAHEVDLFITREIIQPVRHHLLVQPGTKHINHILSHSQALAQCRNYLSINYAQAELQQIESTAAAAYQVATGKANSAAIGSQRAAEIYGLTPIASNIQDNPNNSTRFIVLSRQGVNVPQEKCKTSIVCQINGERPGSLYEILGEFAKRQVNLTRIESRPARTGLGLYIFFFDIEGSLGEDNVDAAIDAIQAKSLWFKNLGSYPLHMIKN
jgi:prephenate dehydratase